MNTLNNEYGIYLVHSYSNTIVGSTVSNNTVGIYQSHSSQNIICHNNITNNADQVLSEESVNTWDAGYPSGGNYWSHFIGNDTYSGPYQNETGIDGIVDTPYMIDANNTDRYPFMNPWILLHDMAITNVTARDALYGLTEVYPGWKVNVTVTVKNKGDFTDTFNITAYYDENPIGTKNRTVTPQTETAVIVTWEDTTGITPGNYYTMKANATIIGLVDINDEFINGQVNFRIIGDVNDDGRVSVADMVEVDIALGTQPGEPDHNPYADVNGDGNISIADMVAIDIYL